MTSGRPNRLPSFVMVEIGLLDAWSSRAAQDEWAREASSLVQRCLLPELDVLVPAMSSSAEGERFLFVVRAPAQEAQAVAAFVDEQGASVLGNRIREQFDGLPHLKQTGLTACWSPSRRMLGHSRKRSRHKWFPCSTRRPHLPSSRRLPDHE